MANGDTGIIYMSELERIQYVASFPDRLTHKLIQPTPEVPSRPLYLNDLVLCWNEHGAPAFDRIRHTAVSTDINHVDCPVCWSLWKDGVYGN